MLKLGSVFLALLVLTVPALAKPRGPAPPVKGGDKVELRDPVPLPIEIDRQQTASLSPDGKKVLFVERNDNRKYAYHTIGIDGKNETQLFESACPSDDPFALCMGHGIWSPDGKRFAALTAEGGREDLRMVLCDVKTGQTTPLPRELDLTLGAVFDADGVLYYADCTNPDRGEGNPLRCILKKYDAATGKSVELARPAAGIVVGLTMSPRRDRIGGVLVRSKPEERNEPEFHLWAHDLRTGKSAESGAVHMAEDLSRGGLIRWDADGKALYANVAEDEKSEREFSIARFLPFPGAGKKSALTLLQEKKAMFVGAAFAPGKLSIAPKSRREKVVRTFVLDARTDQTVECNLPLFLLDRQGNVGVFRDLRTNKLCTARILLK